MYRTKWMEFTFHCRKMDVEKHRTIFIFRDQKQFHIFLVHDDFRYKITRWMISIKIVIWWNLFHSQRNDSQKNLSRKMSCHLLNLYVKKDLKKIIFIAHFEITNFSYKLDKTWICGRHKNLNSKPSINWITNVISKLLNFTSKVIKRVKRNTKKPFIDWASCDLNWSCIICHMLYKLRLTATIQKKQIGPIGRVTQVAIKKTRKKKSVAAKWLRFEVCFRFTKEKALCISNHRYFDCKFSSVSYCRSESQ